MSVVGFDFGNESGVVAVARQRGIDVVLNDESKRETPAVVCFGEKQRFLGTAGAASSMMNPKNTISQIKRLIGRKFSDPELQRDLSALPYSVSEGPDGYPLIHARYLGEVRAFTPTQVLGMVFSNLKSIAEKNLNAAVVDCCIGIPVYFTDLQRRAVIDAATIAGLHPLRLMHETTATALAYGIYKTDLPENDQLNVAFVDIGHASMQVCIVGFKKGQLKILAHSFDQSLGGRDFDEVLFHYFAAKFKEEYKIDVFQNARACLRLRAACEKLKKVLSANAEAPLNIECLMEEKDVRGFIKREEFEQLIVPLLSRVTEPLEKALLDAGLSVENIHSVEVVGSGSRVPAVIRRLTEFFGKEPRRTMNASECVAKGCALQCAILSPTFKVREFQVEAPKKKVKKTNIPVAEFVYGGMANADVQKAVEKEFEMALQDRVMEETKDKKNAVEAYVYDMRNKLHDKYQEFVLESERGEFIAKLQEVEDWLYEDGEDETKGVYIAKLEELKKQGDPIEERYKEHMERGSVIDQVVYCINSYREAAMSTDPKFDHIDLAEKQKVLNECAEAEAWLREKKQLQDSLPKHAPPILLSADVRRKAEAVDRFCRPIMTKPKPAKPVTPEMSSPSPPEGSEPQPQGAENGNLQTNADEGAAAGGEVPPAAAESMETDKPETTPSAP
ncbi:unnamed protein product [Ilex paraguariensis]|uniref:Uncharacterized protein n=1 Tax=Ilex paraguariensis TaxID=185542 RepID=A0ABC8T1Z7_9AQUA